MANMILKTGHDAKVAIGWRYSNGGSFNCLIGSLIMELNHYNSRVSLMRLNPKWKKILSHYWGFVLVCKFLWGSTGLTKGVWVLWTVIVSALGFPPQLPAYHMGWNETEVEKTSPLFNGLEHNSRFYFAIPTICVLANLLGSNDCVYKSRWQNYCGFSNGNDYRRSISSRKSHRFALDSKELWRLECLDHVLFQPFCW